MTHCHTTLLITLVKHMHHHSLVRLTEGNRTLLLLYVLRVDVEGPQSNRNPPFFLDSLTVRNGVRPMPNKSSTVGCENEMFQIGRGQFENAFY